MLFDVLTDDSFRPLSGKYRHAYAAILRRFNDGLFSVEAMDQPTKQDVVRDLTEAIAEHRAGLQPEADEGFRLTPLDAYTELVSCGWLTEQREGWALYVEMDERSVRLLETLCGLRQRPTATFGGTMVAVTATIESAVADPSAAAQGVVEAARRAREFARYTRGIVGSLKGIEKTMLAQASLNGLVRTFFDDFVDRILIGDYRNLTLSKNHPYGFKWRIRDAVETIQGDESLLNQLIAGLVVQGGEPDEVQAEQLVHKSLRDIVDALDLIEAYRQRIDLSKANVERRFSNTLRYLDLIETGKAERFSLALRVLGAALPKDRPGHSEIDVRTGLLPPVTHYDQGLIAPSQTRRPPIETHRFRQQKPDPLRMAFDHAKSEFDRRLAITPQRFMDYLKAKTRGKLQISAADIPPADLEEMVIFSALLAQPGEKINLPDGMAIRRRGPGHRVENKWIECDDFVIEATRAEEVGSSHAL